MSVVVESVGRGVLMHKFSDAATADLEAVVRTTNREKPTAEADAEASAYRLAPVNGEKGQLYLPGEHFLMAISSVGSQFKIGGQGKKTFKDAFKGCLDVQPDALVLMNPTTGEAYTEYVIDSRPAKIPSTGGRVMRRRPHFKVWRAEFEVIVSDDSIPFAVVQDAIQLAGRTKGVGDYRPRFGTFRVVECKKV